MSAMSEELSIMVSCLRESQLQATHFKSTRCVAAESPDATEDQASVANRRYEVCFKHAEWRMTEADGQIGIAYLFLTNFLYTRVNYETDSGCHQLELGDFKASIV
jgi:Golgi-body localisation protein domain